MPAHILVTEIMRRRTSAPITVRINDAVVTKIRRRIRRRRGGWGWQWTAPVWILCACNCIGWTLVRIGHAHGIWTETRTAFIKFIKKSRSAFRYTIESRLANMLARITYFAPCAVLQICSTAWIASARQRVSKSVANSRQRATIGRTCTGYPFAWNGKNQPYTPAWISLPIVRSDL